MEIDNYTIDDLFDILEIDKNNADINDVNEKVNDILKNLMKKKEYDMIPFFNNMKKKLASYFSNPDNKSDYNIIEKKKGNIINTHDIDISPDTLNPTFKNIIERVVCIDSQFRQHIIPYNSSVNSLTNPTNFTIDLSEPLNNVISMKLYSYNIPKSWYNISSENNNNFFYIGDKKISVSDGFYSPKQLVSAIQTDIDNKNIDVSFRYTEHTGKVDISNNNTSSPINIYFYHETYGSNTNGLKNTFKINNSLGWLLGYRPSDNKNINDISECSINIKGNSNKILSAIVNTVHDKYFYIVVDDFNKNHLNKSVIHISDYDNFIKMPKYYSCDISFSKTNKGTYKFDQGYSNTMDNNYKLTGKNGAINKQVTKAQAYTMEVIKNTTRRNNRLVTPNDLNVIGIVPIYGFDKDFTFDDIKYISSSPLNTNKKIYFGPVNINRLKIQLIDERGNLVNLNGLDWGISLLVEQLYQY